MSVGAAIRASLSANASGVYGGGSNAGGASGMLTGSGGCAAVLPFGFHSNGDAHDDEDPPSDVASDSLSCDDAAADEAAEDCTSYSSRSTRDWSTALPSAFLSAACCRNVRISSANR